MLLKLIKIRLHTLVNSQSGKGNKKRKTGLIYLFLCLYVGIVFGFLFYSSFSTLFDGYCAGQGLDALYFAMSTSLSLMLGFIGSVMITQSQLFDAKDNELLLAMPIKPSVILMSRVLTLYLWSCFFGLVSMVPAMLVYAGAKEVTVGMLVTFIIELITVPLLALSLSILIAWIIQFFARFVKNKSIFIILFTFVALGLYMYVVTKLDNFTTYLSENGESVEAAYAKSMYPLYACGKAISEPGINTLIMLAVTVLPFALVLFVLSKNFISLVTAKKGFARTEYKAGDLKTSSVRKALVLKELDRFVKSATWVVNGGFACLMQIAAAIILFIKRDTLVQTLTAMSDDPVWAERFIVVLAIALVTFCGALTDISISSISMEGNMLWVIKSAPVRTIDILKAKLYAHLIVALPFSAVSGIVLNIAFAMNPLQRVLAVALPVVFQIFNAYFGLAVNLAFPKLDWNNEAYAIKQSTAAMVGALGGMGFALMMIIGVLVLGNVLSYEAILTGLLVIFALGALTYEKYLHGKGTRRFEAL